MTNNYSWYNLDKRSSNLTNLTTILARDEMLKKSSLVQYYIECHDSIVIGHELQTELELLMSYILGENPAISFSLKKPHARINFIESEIKLFEAPFAGKPFKLQLWQKAFIEALFGFSFYDAILDKEVNLFQEFTLLVARKNGKTPFLAAIMIADWWCGPMGSNMLCASNTYDNASLLFSTMCNFIDESKKLSKCTKFNIKSISWGGRKQKKLRGKHSKENKGTIKKMSAKGNGREGRNLKFVAADEIHEFIDQIMVLQLKTSLSTQENPLYGEISTEGIVIDGYLDKRLKMLRASLSGEITMERTLIWLYTQDSKEEIFNDMNSWTKSNPSLGVCKKLSYLQNQFETARFSKQDRAFIMAKEFNEKDGSPLAWLDEQDVKNDETFDLEEFRNCYCIAGADLAETNDLAAVAIMFIKKFPNGQTKEYYHTMYFVTEYKAGDDNQTFSPTNPEKKNYRDWAEEGYCRIAEGNELPDAILAEYLWELWKKYGIRPFKVGYDQYRAKNFISKIEKYFGTNVPDRVPQDYKALNTPMHNLGDKLHLNEVNFQNNPICRWCFRNTAVKYDSNGFIMPAKLENQTGNKIDGTVAKIICKATQRSFYNEFSRYIINAI